MINAAGAIFISLKTSRLLLNYRAKDVKFPLSWGFFGGKIEDGEKVTKGLTREIREEIGFVPKYKKVLPLDIYTTIDTNFTYYTFAVLVNEEFIPDINEESGGYGWFNIDSLPHSLHPGARAVITHPNFSNNFRKLIKNNKD